MPTLRRVLGSLVVAALLLIGLAPPSSAAPGVPGWAKDAVIYEVNVRQYTAEGTFDAFAKHLPRLKKLGVEILWFMPIYPIAQQNKLGTLGSYYSVRDYEDVNPEFGTLRDFEALVRQAHRMGFKVVLDFVPNHTGWDHPWLTEHPDWYLRNEAGQPVPPPGQNWSDVIQLNWANSDMRKALVDAMRFWVREVDVDGFRMDYVHGIPDDFWPQVTRALPDDVFMLAENEDKTHLLRKDFHANYGWTGFGTTVEIAQGRKTAADLRAYLEWVDATYPRRAFPMMFTSNHDENSWHGTTRELFGDAERTMAVLTFVTTGMPLIYSGQEAGLDKRLLFFDKDEIPWTDLSMQAFYEKLTKLKKQHRALWNGADGGTPEFLPADNENVLTFVRDKSNDRVLVVANLSPTAVTTTVKTGWAHGHYTDYFTGSRVRVDEEETLQLEPWEYRVLTH
jgi:glycosidase